MDTPSCTMSWLLYHLTPPFVGRKKNDAMGQACPGSPFHHLSACASHLRLPHPDHLRLRKDNTLCSSLLTSPVEPQRSSAACFQTETVRVTKATIIVFMSKERKSHLGYDLGFRSVGTRSSVNGTEVFPGFVFILVDAQNGGEVLLVK